MATQLQQLITQREEAEASLRKGIEKLRKWQFNATKQYYEQARILPLPVFLLSYPHGRKLHISTGKRTELSASQFWSTVYHDAASCNGSSGGLVLDVTALAPGGANNFKEACLPHSGVTEEGD